MPVLRTSPRHTDGCISEFNALLQAPRIARARGISIATLRALIADHTMPRDPRDERRYARVDVRALNAALLRLEGRAARSARFLAD